MYSGGHISAASYRIHLIYLSLFCGNYSVESLVDINLINVAKVSLNFSRLDVDIFHEQLSLKALKGKFLPTQEIFSELWS